MERVQTKTKRTRTGRVRKPESGRSGEGGVTPEQSVGVWKLSCQETHAKSLSREYVR